MRLLHPAAGLCALAVVLTGCGPGSPSPEETMLTMPASPSAGPGAVTGAPSAAAPDSGAGAATASDPHCVMVAGGVTTAMLAPLSLRSTTDPQELLALEQQILDLRDKVPAELHDDFTTLAYSVEAPPKGSGTFDEKRFRRAMAPVQEWLGKHCTNS